jgi:hypothetical protein
MASILMPYLPTMYEELSMDYFRNSKAPVVKCRRDCGIDKKEDEYKLISVESPRAKGSGYDSSILQRQEA